MFDKAWFEKINIGITVSDCEGKIIYMNEKSAEIWEKSGGRDLLGKSLFDCHPEPAKTMLADLLAHQHTNCYTIEKNSQKKLIYQTPVYDENGNYSAYAELSIELPTEMKNFER